MAKTQIFKDYKEFDNRADKAINGVTEAFAEKHGIDLDADVGNVGCWDCFGCTDCTLCTDCTDCAYGGG